MINLSSAVAVVAVVVVVAVAVLLLLLQPPKCTNTLLYALACVTVQRDSIFPENGCNI
jgi:hypothetical protein